MEIKTKVAAATLSASASDCRSAPIFCKLGDETCNRLVPEDHLMQVLQQSVVFHSSFSVNAVASETGILYTVVISTLLEQRSAALNAIVDIGRNTLSWCGDHATLPEGIEDNQTKYVLENPLDFWKLLNRRVMMEGPFLPLKLFKHATQSFYSKTKGGVDGSTQQRAILRSPSSHLKWEQKIVSQVFKTLAVNSFIAWRIWERKDLLKDVESFKSLDKFRNAVNKVSSTAEFMIDVSVELLTFAQTINPNRKRTEEPAVGSFAQEQRLIEKARGRKQKRLVFFNSEDGRKLRLDVKMHDPVHRASNYCALCGQTSETKHDNEKQWRGHRTSIHCATCDVPLCAKIHPGKIVTCFRAWHSQEELVPRSTVPRSSVQSGIRNLNEPESIRPECEEHVAQEDDTSGDTGGDSEPPITAIGEKFTCGLSSQQPSAIEEPQGSNVPHTHLSSLHNSTSQLSASPKKRTSNAQNSNDATEQVRRQSKRLRSRKQT